MTQSRKASWTIFQSFWSLKRLKLGRHVFSAIIKYAQIVNESSGALEKWAELLLQQLQLSFINFSMRWVLVQPHQISARNTSTWPPPIKIQSVEFRGHFESIHRSAFQFYLFFNHLNHSRPPPATGAAQCEHSQIAIDYFSDQFSFHRPGSQHASEIYL